MNMDVSPEELKQLLEAFLKRLDKMDKERDVMLNKLKNLSEGIKDTNRVLDDICRDMVGDYEAELKPQKNLTKEELNHIKRISDMIVDDDCKFLDDDEFLTLIHSVVGEA